MIEDISKILVTEDQIRERTAVLAEEINSLYADAGGLTIIAVINGALLFAADLVRQIRIPIRLDCMRVSSYKEDDNDESQPEIIDMLRLDLRHQHVLIVDDVLDTGHTSQKVLEEIAQLEPASLRLAVLLEKSGRREVEKAPDFVGFTIPDEFVVGYGLDFAEHYRNLPCIGVLRAELQNPPEWM